MKFLSFLLLCASATLHAAPLPLSDGLSFLGWEGDTTKLWRTVDGAFVGGSLVEKVPHNDFLATQKTYKDFDLRLKFKIVAGEGFVNGGVQFRSERVPNFEMKGYQADLGEGYWGMLYDESRRNKSLAGPSKETLAQVALKPGEWNDYRIRCEGPHIQLWINGVQTVDYTEADASIPQEGKIGLQIHGGGKAEAWYKDFVIEELGK